MARPKRTSTAASTPSAADKPASARSSPRISSAKSTPRSAAKSTKASGSTPLRQSVTSTPTRAKWIEKSAKTSPYFPRPKTGRQKVAISKRGNKIAPEESDDEVTGMTESESNAGSSSDDGGSEDNFDPSSDDEDEGIEDEDDDDESVDSDYLDDEDGPKKRKAMIKGGGPTGKAKKAKISHKASSTGKAAKNGSQVYIEGYEDEDEDEDDTDLEEGQEIAGRIYPAPRTGQVPPGRISQNSLNFLKNLQIPERNDRDWFRSHEPAFRQAEKEWKAFVGIVQSRFHEADDEVPILPPNDIIHRIYRDVRFSSDKTPYKKNFSMSTSRGGRKGIWAAYHLSISPNNRSLIAAGVWQPGKNELASIRHQLLTNPRRFRDVIEKKEFVKLFGEAKEKKGKRQNVFGNDDALKVAPKGIEKDHKDIDLLKLRSVAVVHHFTDEQVISEDFQNQLHEVLVIMRPFVRMLNDFIALPTGNDRDAQANGDDGAVNGDNSLGDADDV
ncbi:hypothetical protein I317_00608 [Kwoniella heveanensis CBS 569]|nr:hypothetical protein I317_00608 [Kwoniella heveanensis CBS 569]